MSDQAKRIFTYVIFPLLIVVGWFGASQYTFNSKADLNGDNYCYYILASSLATGQGYSELSIPGTPATSVFPPGYPMLMAPLRMITDSIVAQKWLNELFVLGSLLLLYFLLLRLGLSMGISFAAAFAGAFIPRLLHFSTMMMSEASFVLTSMAALYFMLRMSEKEDDWWCELRQPWLYLMILTVALNYHVRTQGVALIAAVVFGLLIRKRWIASAATMAGFVLCCLPWMMRNKMLGLNGNRYVDSMMQANPWHPEEGTIGMGEFIQRFFETMKMLLFQAIPNTVMPFMDCNPDQPEYTWVLYLVGTIMIALMLVGCWQMGRLRWTVFGYVGASLCVISMFATPSGSRYLTTLLPLLTALMLIGIWWLLTKLVQLRWPKAEFPAYALLLLCLLSKPGLQAEHDAAKLRYPLPYQQFFSMGKQLKKSAPKDAVVCSRKPQMLYVTSGLQGVQYKYTPDTRELIENLVERKVDYVILDALGYSSTYRYLWPAVQAYPQFFQQVVMHYDDTHSYLIKFDRSRAEQELGM